MTIWRRIPAFFALLRCAGPGADAFRTQPGDSAALLAVPEDEFSY